jgi:hypothetical protein
VTEKETSDVSYTVEKGGGQTWTRGSDQGAEFVVKRSENDEETFELFKELKVDGNTVPENAYSKASGSLIIDMKASYLETLSEGKHTLTAVFEDGSAETEFTITGEENPGDEDSEEAISPDDPGDDKSSKAVIPEDETADESEKAVKTGDTSDLGTWLIILLAALTVLSGLGIKGRSKKNS